MKLKDLNVQDLFYWKGQKYMVFIKLKDEKRVYKIPCMVHPNPDGCIDMPSNRIVKPIYRVKAGQTQIIS